MEETASIAHDIYDSSCPRSEDVILDSDVHLRDFQLDPRTLAGLQLCGFSRPSPIQARSIPLGRCGFDLIIQSKAGTGKTAVFTVIALEALRASRSGVVQSIVVAPTREIAIQTQQVIQSVGQKWPKFKCALCIGGTTVKTDRAQINEGCRVVVGTPGRLVQLIELNVIDTQHVELFVLDEADKLIEEQFKSQIDQIYRRLPRDKQTLVASATYPDDLLSLIRRYLVQPKFVRVGTELAPSAVEELYVESEAGHSARKTLQHKYATLKRLLSKLEFCKCIVFTNFQARAPLICQELADHEAAGAQVSFLSAELAQEERNQIFGAFKNSKQRLLVSTDVSARGIDISDIDLVVNFDLPMDASTYLHRMGRSGRFGRKGRTVSIVSMEKLDKSTFEKIVLSPRVNKLIL